MQDGVFRAVPHGQSDDQARVLCQEGVWSVVMNVCGELYQAYFESELAAREAFEATGCKPDS